MIILIIDDYTGHVWQHDGAEHGACLSNSTQTHDVSLSKWHIIPHIHWETEGTVTQDVCVIDEWWWTGACSGCAGCVSLCVCAFVLCRCPGTSWTRCAAARATSTRCWPESWSWSRYTAAAHACMLSTRHFISHCTCSCMLSTRCFTLHFGLL